MNKDVKDLLNEVPSAVHQASIGGEISFYGFTQFADRAYHLLRGLSTMATILEMNKLMTDDEEQQDNPLRLNDYHTGALLSMIRSVSDMAANQVTETVNHAKRQLEQPRAGKGTKARGTHG